MQESFEESKMEDQMNTKEYIEKLKDLLIGSMMYTTGLEDDLRLAEKRFIVMQDHRDELIEDLRKLSELDDD